MQIAPTNGAHRDMMDPNKAKHKEYKYFALPNELTPLETLYYYLLEFDVIPRTIPAERLIIIFDNAARDYLRDTLTTSAFSLIAQSLLFSGQPYEIDRLSPGLGILATYCSELEDDFPDELEIVRKILKIYTISRQKYVELSKTGEIDKMFTM